MVLPELQRVLAAGVNPRRITQALDLRELYGPEVDLACGGAEPMVDEWEAGERTPTGRQLRKLAALTGFPPAFFARDDPPGWDASQVFVCSIDHTHGAPAGTLFTPRPATRPAATRGARLPQLPPGVLPECTGPCGRPMRRATWVAQGSRCSRCGPA